MKLTMNKRAMNWGGATMICWQSTNLCSNICTSGGVGKVMKVITRCQLT